MSENKPNLASTFPELANPEKTVARISQAFITGQQAFAAFSFVDLMRKHFGSRLELGKNASIFPIDEIGSLIFMIGDEAVLNFHIVEEAELDEDPFNDEGKGLQELDYQTMNGNGHSKEAAEDAEATLEADDDETLDEGVYYQIGVFLLDNAVMPHETIFEREDLDCRTYSTFDDPPVEGRLYQARMVLELEDLHHPELVAAIYGAAEYILDNPNDFESYIDEHDADMAKVFSDASLFERITEHADFDNVIDL